MSYTFYKILHVAGALLLFMSLGGALVRAIQPRPEHDKSRALIAASHGVALLILLVAGFGAAGKGGFFANGFPIWIGLKMGIWLLLGGLLGAINRKPAMAKPLWALVAIVGAAAGYIAIAKPFL